MRGHSCKAAWSTASTAGLMLLLATGCAVSVDPSTASITARSTKDVSLTLRGGSPRGFGPETYKPMTYKGRVVFFDETGVPHTYVNGARCNVPVTDQLFFGYIHHFRDHRKQHAEWARRHGHRYGRPRAPAPRPAAAVKGVDRPSANPPAPRPESPRPAPLPVPRPVARH